MCVIDQEGRKVAEKRLRNYMETILDFLSPYQHSLKVAVESTLNWYWLVDGLQEQGITVSLAHTLYLKAIAYAKVKTDKVDAYTLAQLIRLNMLPEAYIYPKETRPARDLLRRRMYLVNLRSSQLHSMGLLMLKKNIHGYDRNRLKKVSLAQLKEMFPNPDHFLSVSGNIRIIKSLDLEIKEIEKQILSKTRETEAMKLIKTIPGVGDILAMSILYETGDINRFPSAQSFCSYCRLIPGTSQSDRTVRQGRNKKQGNKYLKWAFSEAAYYAIRYYPRIESFYARKVHQRGVRSIARAIVAHKLGIATYHVLKKGVKFEIDMIFH